MDFDEMKKREQSSIVPTYGRYPIAISTGEGAWVSDPAGKKYLDFLSGLAVCNLGHCHPAIADAVSEQVKKLIHVSNLYYTENQVKLAEKISELSFKGKTFFANSGAEANEAAIKLCRKRGNAIRKGKNKLLSLKNSFHGRTLATITLTGQPALQEGFEPLLQNIEYIEHNNINDLEKAFDDDVCGLFIEVIQGESGINPCSSDFLSKCRELCDKHDALLVTDEVQSGIWRTGKFVSFLHTDIKPDVFTLAKALANGFPIGAMHASEKVMDVLGPKSHASTFGGTPFVTNVALTVIDIVEKDILPTMDNTLDKLWAILNELKDKYSFINHIRGKGFMIGIAVDIDARKILDKMHENGILANAIGEKTLRLLPPLIIGDNEINAFKEIMNAVLSGM